MRFDIITIFPDIFASYFKDSIIKRAQQKKLIKIVIHDLRRWATDKRRTVDDKPYGGGPGMVFKVEPLYRAILTLIKINLPRFALPRRQAGGRQAVGGRKSKVILLTPKGKQFNQRIAERLSKLKNIVLVCGRYEGFDERVVKFIDEQISIGPYVLTGGEIPAMIIVDAVARLIPGVIRSESLMHESFSLKSSIINHQLSINFEYPQYTRPEIFTYKDKSGRIKNLKVPKVLLSGNHVKIKEWREKNVH